mmetsp:Transcript_102751/g.314328  ORF Transcript_102751/g.314328 Transcript_102751/m.314328 type:complete len:243 (-) Transcript_102751:216-944(-)
MDAAASPGAALEVVLRVIHACSRLLCALEQEIRVVADDVMINMGSVEDSARVGRTRRDVDTNVLPQGQTPFSPSIAGAAIAQQAQDSSPRDDPVLSQVQDRVSSVGIAQRLVARQEIAIRRAVAATKAIAALSGVLNAHEVSQDSTPFRVSVVRPQIAHGSILNAYVAPQEDLPFEVSAEQDFATRVDSAGKLVAQQQAAIEAIAPLIRVLNAHEVPQGSAPYEVGQHGAAAGDARRRIGRP